MRRAIRLVLLAGVALTLTMRIGASTAEAHGTQDQVLNPEPGCIALGMKGGLASSSTPRQEFVPQAGDIRGIDVCVEVPTATTAFISARIRTGTAAAPGTVITELSAPQSQAGPYFDWVHIEFPSPAELVAGSTYVIELTQGSPTGAFVWRGTCGTVAGSCSSVEDFYPAGETNAGTAAGDFGFRTFEATDPDLDGWPEASDNCPFVANPAQENSDGSIDLAPWGITAYDDRTNPNSDVFGDACDGDDDNDGILDSTELAGPCGAPTDPMKPDTDGDLATDYAECALGFNPNDANNTPPVSYSPPTLDSDSDGLPNDFEQANGFSYTNPNEDNDNVLDGREFKYFGTSQFLADTDADECSDAKEISSVNGDLAVTAIDLSQVAQRFLAERDGDPPTPVYVPTFDMNRDSKISAIDLSLVAQNFGPCVV